MINTKICISLSKSELAIRYNPNTTSHNAVRILRKWILHNLELMAELKKANYDYHNHLLTPLQIRIIFKYLGEP